MEYTKTYLILTNSTSWSSNSLLFHVNAVGVGFQTRVAWLTEADIRANTLGVALSASLASSAMFMATSVLLVMLVLMAVAVGFFVIGRH